MSAAKKIQKSESFGPLVHFVCQLVSKEAGIVLGERQSVMVETRIKKRMIDLGLVQPSEYVAFIKRHFLEEKEQLVGLLTTHHTFFFREFQQVEALLGYLPEIIKNVRDQGRNKITVWSAACSRGQEVYTLAMFLDFHVKRLDPSMTFEIKGSDIDSQSVKIAKNAVYTKKEINKIPQQFLANHWARGTGKIANYVKAKKSLMEYCNFEVQNLMDLKMHGQKFDIIFVRNVLIYFNDPDVAKITEGLTNCLNKNGLIVCGASESLSPTEKRLNKVAPYTYKFGAVKDASKEAKPIEALQVKPSASKKLRVLCVDDSASVLKLLKKILSPEAGFEVVGVAENGVVAHEMVQELKPDLMTLDIHMPEMDGISYMEAHYSSSHPPVVVVSSASREDSSTALKILSLGASDFVEKPSLSNLLQRGDEICSKLRVASAAASMGVSLSSVDKDFSEEVSQPDPFGKALLVYATMGRQKPLQQMLSQTKLLKIPTLIMFEGQENLAEAFSKQVETLIGKPVEVFHEGTALELEATYVVPFEKLSMSLEEINKDYNFVTAIFGECSKVAQQTLSGLSKNEIIVEDLGKAEPILSSRSKYTIPATSFSYHITELFNKFEGK